MRRLTFKRFLEEYLLEYSGSNSLSIHKLANKAKKDARLRELLFLYCSYLNKCDLLFKYCDETLFNEFPHYSKETIDNKLLNETSGNYYSRILNSYINIIKNKEYENEYKLALLSNIKKIMKEKNISTYRVYTDLSLNPGNINDFCTNKNPNKVSVQTCKKIYDFVTNY